MIPTNEDQRFSLRVPVTTLLPVACPPPGLVAPCRLCSSASGRCPDIVHPTTIMSTLRPDRIADAITHQTVRLKNP